MFTSPQVQRGLLLVVFKYDTDNYNVLSLWRVMAAVAVLLKYTQSKVCK